jgi:hypothetical protein
MLRFALMVFLTSHLPSPRNTQKQDKKTRKIGFGFWILWCFCTPIAEKHPKNPKKQNKIEEKLTSSFCRFVLEQVLDMDFL